MATEIALAETLRKTLKERKITQSELSVKLNVSKQVISKYCVGDCSPSLELILKISQLLNISIEELITGEKPENKPWRDDLGLSEQSIENIKAIKNCVVNGDNGSHFSLMPILNLLLSNKDLRDLLLHLDIWLKQLMKSPIALKHFIHHDIDGTVIDFYDWRIMNICADFLLKNLRPIAIKEYEKNSEHAKNIAQSI